MTMASNSLLCPNYLIPISTSTPTARHTFPSRPYLPSASYYIQSTNCKREFPLPRVASIPYQPNNVDYLEEEFSGHGVTFEGIGDSCVAKMELENGSVATLLLPSGLITSYKAPMWHGGKVELLHTSVSEGQDGDAVIKGGVSLAFNFQGDSDEVSWSPSKWALHDIRGTAEESIQVELINRESEGMIELKYIVTLEEDVLSSELVISNSKFSSLQLTGSILSHLTVSTPDATYALGLERSNIFTRPPILSEFAISPPDSEQEDGFNKLLSQVTVERLFPGWGARNQNNRNEAARQPYRE
ncbi:putative NDH-dependent cyclic electron flow 5 [Quillaja saponaria]|uniref:NDH-dependent cyclic electron flow 5 n=1 Tax=Quillaja saponaria TaxID=32244 RepID=A0AAD7VHS8_QUISA|nr:putative NDH-dependent cyclic electron flow 5 [Quillaja saponaria]